LIDQMRTIGDRLISISNCCSKCKNFETVCL